MCCALVRPDGEVPVAGMTVSALQTLIEACVREGLSDTVTRPQTSVSHVPSQFGVTSVPAAGSSAEVLLPRRGSIRQSETLPVPLVAREVKLGRNLARLR